MMQTVLLPDKTVTLVAEECFKCGVVFAMPADLQRNRRQDQQSFFCPNGHSQAYIQSEATRLRNELAQTKARLDQEKARVESLRSDVARERETVAHQDRRINGYKGVVARTKRRVSKGVCPCCSAKFRDLKQHMQTEHPHWDPDKGAEAMAK